MDAPPPSGTIPIPSAFAHASYADSVESSPRSRTTEAWDDRDSLPAAAAGGKLRLMCSFGGHIIPRPQDKSLSYVGGDTRMVVVDRNISLGELHARLSRNLLNNQPFTLKYQLPSEDLDSLISVTSDEDLENMIDEFDRICESSVGKSSRLRVFLFVNNHESTSSMELIFGGSVKSEDWFYNALNGSQASATDAKSVNSLLGLENASFRPGNSKESETDFSKNLKSNNQEAPPIPDSVLIHTSPSSFGSTSSSLANLPPIRVRVEGGDVDGKNKVRDQGVGVEEQFTQISVSADGKQDEGFAVMSSPPPIPITLIPASVNPLGELPERINSDDDERSDQGVPVGYGRTQAQYQLQTQLPQQQTHPQQKPSSPDSASSDGNILHQELPPGISRITSNIPWMQDQQKVSESGYQLQQLQHQLLQLQQQQQNQQHRQQQQNQQHRQQQQQNQQHRQQQQNQQHHQQQQNQQNQQQQQQQHHQQQQHQQHQQNHQQHQQHQQQQEHLQQQQQQQQEHLQQQQQQQHQQQQQQQHQQQQQQHQQQLQPQQFIHPGTHYLQHPQNAMPISQYYHMYPPPTQHHQTQLDQHQYPFYFMPPIASQPQQAYNMSMQQSTYSEPSNDVPSSRSPTPPVPTNTSAYSNQPRNVAPDNSEMVSGDYRAAIPSVQSMVQIAPGQQMHQQPYMTYPQVHAPQSMAQPQNPPLGTNSSYAYEYSDPSQIYFTQPLANPAQYQTMVSSSPIVILSDAPSVQDPNNNMKHQNINQAQ